ncbi:hypothetical protein SAY86_027237 [Trapa natans]|uniref:Uncharacterized protein n=1 Tax=Trapa natans TaxID=22666 RepID=A0AAN7KU08_TRANT|nr:hypothetical protein SAY86_027237 [Trapa natans]
MIGRSMQPYYPICLSKTLLLWITPTIPPVATFQDDCWRKGMASWQCGPSLNLVDSFAEERRVGGGASSSMYRGRAWSFPFSGGRIRRLDLYLYKNEFNFLPRWVGQLQGLKTLKFFANEVNLFPAEFADLVSLERLHVKIPPPGLEGLALHKLRGLKELELSKGLPWPCVFPLMSEIAQLKCLIKLSVCHFSIRCLPPEIGCLNKLEYLDLSFNKMKSLPNEITSLSTLISLNVSHNKLLELPCDLAFLQQMETLDLPKIG